jgi:hypothetical protein
MNRKNTSATIFLLILLFSHSGYAAQRIAILNFELNDITSLPNTPAELKRTASLAPLLTKALTQTGDYEIVEISRNEQKHANAGFGYLFRFHDLAAQLGKKFGADWIIVGQHSKPSFLYSHLMAHIINVSTACLAGDYDIELKGNHTKVTERSVIRLAREISDTVSGPVLKLSCF